MPQWLVKLAGDDIDLRSLSGQFREPECRVDKDTDGVYHLTSDTFDSMTVAAEVHTASSDMLLLINDLMKVRNPEYRPALLDKVVRINDDGTRSGYVFGSATMRGSGRATAEGIVIAPDGKVVPSPEPDKSQARLKLAEQDAKVREVLVYWRGCNAGDSDLCFNAYKVYEIIREDGQPKLSFGTSRPGRMIPRSVAARLDMQDTSPPSVRSLSLARATP